MGYYKNNNGYRSNNNYHKRSNNKPHPAQDYVWVVYNFRQGRNHTFTSKVQALQYYYNNEFSCFTPSKKDH